MIPKGRVMVPGERGCLKLNPKIPMEIVRRTMTGKSRVKTSGDTSRNGEIAPLVPTTASASCVQHPPVERENDDLQGTHLAANRRNQTLRNPTSPS